MNVSVLLSGQFGDQKMVSQGGFIFGIFEETAEHLLLYCSAFEHLEIDSETAIEAIEAKCKEHRDHLNKN